MSNIIKIRSTTTAGKAPTLAQLVAGELAANLADGDLYMSTGSSVLQLNAAANIKTDAGHRFVSDAQIAELTNIATSSVLGHVMIGNNIAIDATGVISVGNASATTSGVLSSVDWNTFNGKQANLGFTPVNVAGDTMTGLLTLSGDPTATNHAATKHYVDVADAAAVKKAGDTMTGLLVLSADPAQALGAATKQYVDGAVNAISGSYGAPVQSLTVLVGIVSTTLLDKQMRLVEDTGAIFRYDVQSTVAADGVTVVVPTDLVAGGGAGRWIKVQGATQSHELLTGLMGGAANDHIHLTTAEKNGYDAHLADVIVHLSSAQHTWLSSINASAVELNYMVGVTSSVQTQLNSKQAALGYTPLNEAGGTMTGPLVLAGDPTAALNPVTLQYAQAMTLDGGTY